MKYLIVMLAMLLVPLVKPVLAATYNVAASKSATLILLTVDTINFSNQPCSYIDAYVTGTDGWARLDGTNPGASADESFRIPAGTWRRWPNPTPYASQIKLLSTVGVNYSVECAN